MRLVGGDSHDSDPFHLKRGTICPTIYCRFIKLDLITA